MAFDIFFSDCHNFNSNLVIEGYMVEKSKLEDQSDEELMEMYRMEKDQTSSKLAFEILFKRHSGRVSGYLKKRLSNSKEAQDLVQEVFLKLHRSRHQYNSSLPFSPWLFSITRSVWLDGIKKRKIEQITDNEILEKIVAPSQMLENSSLELDISVLKELPVTQKEAVSLRVIDESTFEEIALKLSTSPENARQLVSRGLKKLKLLLSLKKEE